MKKVYLRRTRYAMLLSNYKLNDITDVTIATMELQTAVLSTLAEYLGIVTWTAI